MWENIPRDNNITFAISLYAMYQISSVIVSLIDNYIRRMPKCNTVLQTENDIFGPLIKPNSPGNCQFSALILTLKSSKYFGHCPVKILVFSYKIYMFKYEFSEFNYYLNQ